MKIKMLKTVRADFPFLCKPGTILLSGNEYEGKSNELGAVCGLCDNGEWLGVKPGEFQPAREATKHE